MYYLNSIVCCLGGVIIKSYQLSAQITIKGITFFPHSHFLKLVPINVFNGMKKSTILEHEPFDFLLNVRKCKFSGFNRQLIMHLQFLKQNAIFPLVSWTICVWANCQYRDDNHRSLLWGNHHLWCEKPGGWKEHSMFSMSFIHTRCNQLYVWLTKRCHHRFKKKTLLTEKNRVVFCHQ